MTKGLLQHGPVVAELACALEAGLDGLVDEMFVVLAQDPDLGGLMTPEYLHIGRAIARADLLDELRALGRGGELPTACPPAVVETARRAADLGAAVTVPIQCYRAGHRVLWRAWQQALEQRPSLGDAAPGLAADGSDFFFSYADRCCSLLLGEFERYRESAMRGRDRIRLGQVQEVLTGTRDELDAVAYALAQTHVAIVVVGRDGSPVSHEEVLPGSGGSLLVPLDASTIWGWVPGGTVPAPVADRARHVGIGCAEQGPEGFRRSHRQAQRALAVALRDSRPVARYEEVALESLAGAGEQALRDFVANELAGLDEPRPARAPLRETILAYFAQGDSLVAAARALGVHERTVAYRLRVVEARLGRRLSVRRAELEAALRLERLLESPT